MLTQVVETTVKKRFYNAFAVPSKVVGGGKVCLLEFD